MRLFGWVQNKLSGKQDNKRSNTSTSYKKQESREEFSDWPQGLLSIGTFGNDNIKEIIGESQKNKNVFNEEIINPSSSNNDHEEILDNIITLEEVGQLQNELTKLLSRNKPNNNNNNNKGKSDLPLDRFLNCPSTLELDRTLINSDDFRDEDIDRTISVIIGKCKEAIYAGNNHKNKKSLAKKSVSFLLNKIFVCQSGFAPAPSLRDSLQESRMEKLLRTMLHKKLSPQNSYRCLEEKNTPRKKGDHDNGYKWDKTDSEYIVLEI